MQHKLTIIKFILPAFLLVFGTCSVSAKNSSSFKKIAAHAISEYGTLADKTDGWVTKADYTDGLHPSVNGNLKIADKLKPILAPYVK